jgi:hypothetical protein
MGLDWNPLARPKPGFEAEYARLLAMDLDGLKDADREATLERFGEISDAPYEVLDAPRVGFDSEADQWLQERLRETGRAAEFPEAREGMRGFYVLDLVPESPGLPVYGSDGYEGVDRYTFRGKFLDDAQHIIGDELYQRAWQQLTAADLGEYGQALLAAARGYAASRGLEHLEHEREPPTHDDQDPAWGTHIVFSAAAWCLWWSAKGFGLEPYF